MNKILAGIFLLPVMSVCKPSLAQRTDLTADPGIDSAAIERSAQLYLDSRERKLDRYHKRASRTTQKFLQKIQRQEQRIANRLRATDTSRYRQFANLKAISPDSLQQQLQDSALLKKAASVKGTAQRRIDSLSRIRSFVAPYTTGQHADALSPGDIQQQAAIREYTEKILRERSKAVQKLLEGSPLAGKAQKLGNIHSQYRQQVQYWKQLSEEPDAAEQKALDYLRGIEGFDEHLGRQGPPGSGALSGKSAAELEQMGYQTKASVEKQLQSQFGDQLNAIQQQAGGQLRQYTDKLGKGLDKAKAAREKIREAGALAAEGKNAISSGAGALKKREGFSNPMRGVPFRKRWEWQYNFQVQRASADGLRPAMLQTGVNVAYRQTAALSLGMGIDGSIGLGSNWQHLKLSYEGIVGRAFADYKIIWGFSLQGGYEKSLRPMNRPYTILQEQHGNAGNVKTAMGLLQDAAYLGIMKRYRISSKWQGTILIGYNFLNDKTNLSSPWIIRLGRKL